MSSLVVVGFPSVAEADQVRRQLVEIQKEELIALEDAVVVEAEPDGKVRLHQSLNLTKAGALGGGFWGTLVGLLFLNPLLGAAVGVGLGAASGSLSDLGINDNFMREVGETLPRQCGPLPAAARRHPRPADRAAAGSCAPRQAAAHQPQPYRRGPAASDARAGEQAGPGPAAVLSFGFTRKLQPR